MALGCFVQVLLTDGFGVARHNIGCRLKASLAGQRECAFTLEVHLSTVALCFELDGPEKGFRTQEFSELYIRGCLISRTVGKGEDALDSHSLAPVRIPVLLHRSWEFKDFAYGNLCCFRRKLKVFRVYGFVL